MEILNFISSIPAELGWFLVGLVSGLCAVALTYLVATIIRAAAEDEEDPEII